jgi:hypothetical protein
MDETYRMLGKEHEADLEREAQRRHLAAELRGRSSADRSADRARKVVLRRFVALTRMTGRFKPKENDEPADAAVSVRHQI